MLLQADSNARCLLLPATPEPPVPPATLSPEEQLLQQFKLLVTEHKQRKAIKAFLRAIVIGEILETIKQLREAEHCRPLALHDMQEDEPLYPGCDNKPDHPGGWCMNRGPLLLAITKDLW